MVTSKRAILAGASFGFALAALFAGVGCGGGSDSATALRFAIVPKLLDNPVFSYARTGAERAAEELGGIEIIWQAPIEADAGKQVEIVEALIQRRVDGLAIACNEPRALKGVIDRAVAAGIPTITWDSDSPESARATYFGIDDEKCGARLGEELARLTAGKGKVALLTGTLGAHNLERRRTGVVNALASHPGIEIVQTVACDDQVDKAVALVESTMKAHPDLAGWAFLGGWPLFGRGALASLGGPRRAKVVSFDALPEMWPYLESGEVQALLGQKYFEWGSESVRILKGLREGRSYPRVIDSGYDLVTLETLPEYRRRWE